MKKIIVCISLVGLILIISGCCNLSNSTNDLNGNKQKFVDSYNRWVDAQNMVRSDFKNDESVFNGHIDTYNSETTKGQPDFSLCLSNFKSDESAFQNLDGDISNLDTATTSFSADTANMGGDLQNSADNSLLYMRAYTNAIKRAQTDEISQSDYMVLYVNSVINGNPDESKSAMAQNEGQQFESAMNDASAASSSLNDVIARLN